MTKNKMLKTVVARCKVSEETMKKLDEAFMKTGSLLKRADSIFSTEMNRSLQKFEIEKWGQRFLHSRTIDLISNRFSKTVTKNLFIPLDDRNSEISKREDGTYVIRAGFIHSDVVGRGNWTEIPFVRKDNLYYSDLIDKWRGPIILIKHGKDVFAYFSIEVIPICKPDFPAVIIGIDLNWEKNAVAIFDVTTGEFVENFFFDCRSYSRTLDILMNRISTIQRKASKKWGKKRSKFPKEIQEELASIYHRRTGTVKNMHGNFVAELVDRAQKYIDDGKNIVFAIEDLKKINERVSGGRRFNRWLSHEWCYARFKNILELKGFPVKDVYPYNTSSKCHRCGKRGTIHGRKGRLFLCEFCGLKNFNRDLNAARNISNIAVNYYSKRWEKQKEKELLVGGKGIAPSFSQL